MKKITGLFLLAVLFTGCAAEMMEKHGDTIQLFGPKDTTRGGVVRYLNNGLDKVRKMRRADAEKKMETFCEGPYKIVEEGPRSKFGASMPIGSSVSLEVDQYWYVRFECNKGPVGLSK